jgi:hypothetical protein
MRVFSSLTVSFSYVEQDAGGVAVIIARIERGHRTPERAQRFVLERTRLAPQLSALTDRSGNVLTFVQDI